MDSAGEHRGDGAFAWHERLHIDSRLTQSGVALRLPPHSMARLPWQNPVVMFHSAAGATSAWKKPADRILAKLIMIMATEVGQKD